VFQFSCRLAILQVKFGTVYRHLSSGRRAARTDENVDTAESLLPSQQDKPQSPQSQKFHVRRGIHRFVSFADFSQRSASQMLQEKARSTAAWSTQRMHTLFSVCSLRDDIVVTSKPTWKP